MIADTYDEKKIHTSAVVEWKVRTKHNIPNMIGVLSILVR